MTGAAETPVRVAGNLPYNVASPILFRLVELFAAGVPLVDATVMLQREVADRLTATPGTRDYGVLSILIGHAAAVERISLAARRVPAGAEGPFRGRQAPVSRSATSGRKAGSIRGTGPGDLHTAAKNPRERAGRFSSERGVSACARP